MKNLLFIFSIFTFIGCATIEPEESVAVSEKSVEEINAERGDPCDCTDESLLAMELFLNKINTDAFKTSIELNAELALTMRDCMQPIGHKAADIAWNASMQGCESFSVVREAMIEVKNTAKELKASEQSDIINTTSTEGANGVLNRLQKEAK